MSNRRSALFVALAIVSLAASVSGEVAAQARVYFRVELGAPVGGAAPVANVRPFDGSFSLAERSAFQAMWGNLQSQSESAVRECRVPLAIEIDASSFRGHLLPGTDDGLPPGTRSRFVDVVRALTAVCHRGDMERSAVQSRVRAVRFGWTDAPRDGIALDGGVFVFETNGDLSGSSHLGYGAQIDWLTHAL